MIIYLLAFLTAFFITLYLTPKVIAFAKKIGATDQPSERKIHKVPIPRLGGMAIFGGLAIAICLTLLYGKLFHTHIDQKLIHGIFYGSLIVFLIGVVDDFHSLPAWFKLVGQVVAALVTIHYKVEISFFGNPWGGIVELGFWTLPITVFWLVGVTNATNLIDGLDGLASGVISIASIALFVVALRTHQIESAIFLIALSGATLGFLRYNFFPAKIFLGDSGSYTLGFVLAAATIAGVLKTTLVVALVLPFLILGVPIYDTASAIYRRIKHKRPVFQPDKEHLHHGLLSAGFSQRESVLIIYLGCVLLSMAALASTILGMKQGIIVLFFIVTALFVAISKMRETNRNDQN